MRIIYLHDTLSRRVWRRHEDTRTVALEHDIRMSDLPFSRRTLLKLTGVGVLGTAITEQVTAESMSLPAQNGLAIDGDTAYLTSARRNGEIRQIDLADRTVVNTFDAPAGRAIGLAYGDGSLWFADGVDPDYDGQILELDPDTGDVRSSIETSYDPRGLAFGNGSLWVVDITVNRVIEYAPDGSGRGQFDVQGPTESTTPRGLAYFDGSLWVGDYCYSEHGCVASVYEFDTDGTLLQETEQRAIPGDENGGYGGLATTDTTLYGPDDTGELAALRTLSSDGSTPTAAFDVSPESPTTGELVSFDASASSSDGEIVSYEWDFDGDGTHEDAGESVQTSFDEAGDVPVTLRVTDDSGQTDTAVQNVSVTASSDGPSAAFEYSPETPFVGDAVTLDATPSTGDRPISLYQWSVRGADAEDKTGRTVTYSFGSAGDVDVELRVTDDLGRTDSVTRTLSIESSDAPPTAAFDVSPSSPTAGETATFDASASSDDDRIDSFEWDFDGDGRSEQSGERTTYTFESSGEYTVALAVTDDAGQATTTRQTVSVDPDGPQPTASFTYGPSDPTTADTVEFDASSSSNKDRITAYEWDFTGDGSTDATGLTARHEFETADEYDVTLTITDDSGTTRSTIQTVTVTESPLQATKDAHASTAREVHDAAISDLGVVSLATTANQEYTRAVETGTIDQATAIEALQRLNTGIETTLTVLEQTGSAPELGGANDRDLTREMAQPTLDTAIQLATSAATATASSGGGGGFLKRRLINGIKSDVRDAIRSLVRSMLGDALTWITSQIESAGESIASEIVDGTLSTAREINERIAGLQDQLLDLVADALQRRVEEGFELVPGPLPANDPVSWAGSLSAGVLGLYTLLDDGQTATNGLPGSTDVALTEANVQRWEIRSQARSAQDLIDDAVEFGNNSNLGSTLAGLTDGPGLIDLLRAISTVVGYFVSGIPTAFATGAGIGSLIEINVRHHVAVYSATQGDAL